MGYNVELGVAVVYLVSEGNGQLLDLHLGQIKRHTQVPFTIYASVNRLRPEFRPTLQNNPNVRIVDCPTTELRWGSEHAYYLEQLVSTAIRDGATYVATLHVDSFPIRSDWVEELAGHLSQSCVLATPDSVDTCCLFFHRDFYLSHHPEFRPSQAELASSEYKRFSESRRSSSRYEAHSYSPTGYVLRAYSRGLSWYELTESNQYRGSVHGLIYDDLIFHLVSASWRPVTTQTNTGLLERWSSAMFPFFWRARRLLGPLVPRKVARVAPRSLVTKDQEILMFQATRKQLLEDPDSFLYRLRTGKTLRKV